MPRGRRWPDEVRRRLVDRVRAGESLGAVARAEGVPKGTLRDWVAASDVEQSNPKTAEQTAAARAARRRQLDVAREGRIDRLSDLADLALDTVLERLRDPEWRDATTVRELVGAFTRANHDLALLTGNPTEAQEVRVIFNVPLPSDTPPPIVDEDDLPGLGP